MQLEQALQHAAPGARVSLQLPDRHSYARDLWPRGLIELQSGAPPSEGPGAIVWPETVEHVQGLVRFAREERVALVPFGAGSGVCGGIFPTRQSVVVDLKRFSAFSVRSGPELDVGAGALGISLEDVLLEGGHTIGHYPSSILISTVGGWVAARGAGQTSGRYGKIEDMVTSLECVLGTGEVVTARRRELGPDLIPLLIGSEGTLGIVTRVGLRLHPAPTRRIFAAFAFDAVEAGVDALRGIFQDGLRPAVARLYDPLDTLLMREEDVPRREREGSREPGLGAAALRAVLRAPELVARAMALAERSLYSRAALVLVHEGTSEQVELEAARAASICQRGGGTPLGEGPARAWYHHRYHVSYRQSPLFRGGAFSDTMEVAVPWSGLLGVYEAVRRALGRYALVMAHFSHSYPDGASIYFTFAGIAHGGDSALGVYDRAWRVALSAALDAGASLSHHHGVGRSKAPRLGEELGTAIGVVRRLKSAWDPNGILNPGALLPPVSAAEVAQVPAPSPEPALDALSACCSLPGGLRLSEAEAWLRERGHTLGLAAANWNEDQKLSVDQWIGLGMPGSPDRYADPSGARLSGFTASLTSGVRIALRPAPRRAVGPDLSALFTGTGGAFGRVESATLAAPRIGAGQAVALPWSGERNPPLDPSESAALERARAELEG